VYVLTKLSAFGSKVIVYVPETGPVIVAHETAEAPLSTLYVLEPHRFEANDAEPEVSVTSLNVRVIDPPIFSPVTSEIVGIVPNVVVVHGFVNVRVKSKLTTLLL